MSAIEKMYHCLPVLERYLILEEQMKNGKFCAALKTLKRLELTYLPQIYPYRFCRIMTENVPKIRVQINEETMNRKKYNGFEAILTKFDSLAMTLIVLCES